MSIRLAFEITFESDYHVGAGHSLGLQVDSALLRDPDGVPVIRGTVLAGLLRERMESLCNLTGKCPDAIVASIFGTPKHKKRWRISSARPASMEVPQLKSGLWKAGEAAAQITTRVRVNPRTRRAEENKLFTREEGDGELRFRFIAECERDDAQAQLEAEWLLAAARMLRNIGAGKHRGYGECDIHFVDRAEEDKLLERFARRLKGEQVDDTNRSAGQIELGPLNLPGDPDSHTHRLRVLLRLDEPLLIARRAEAGNQYETLDTIPGSVLRGALAEQIAQRFDLASRTDAYQHFAALFFGNLVHFSGLTPVEVRKENASTGYPTIVAPRDLLTCELHPGYSGRSKDKGHGVWSLLQENLSECPVCANSATNRKAASVKLETLDGFISLVKGAPRSKHKPRRMLEMHIRIDPVSGRVSTGDLYGYVALEPGQYFVGEITCTDAAVWQTLHAMAGLQEGVNELKLGKAAQRGYGKVSVVFQSGEKPLFHLQDLDKRITSTEQVTMLLLSDAIVPDPWGRFWRGFDPAWLKRELRLPNNVGVSIDCNQDDEKLAFSAVRTVDSFNATLGLPRTRDIAIVAGSSVRLSFQNITKDDLITYLAKIESRGIGLRRDEGFGQVAFNHPIYRQLQGIDSPMLDLSPLKLASAEPSNPLTAMLQFTREWAEKLDEHAFDAFNDERFEAVARLLHVSRHTSVDAIKDELAQMGKPTQALGTSLPGRDKPNFFETDGKRAMDTIGTLLDELADTLTSRQLAQNPQAWRIGLHMLAARIAGPARQTAQERR